MKNKQRRYIIITVIALAVFAILINTFNQTGVQDLEGDFKEVAFYRNENNTGPIIRVYAVTVNDTLWNEMQQYGELMPHTKYGNTKVYFFLEGSAVPSKLSPEEPFMPVKYQKLCLAKYEKASMGQVTFTKYPFQ